MNETIKLVLFLLLAGALSGCTSTPKHPFYSSVNQEELAKEKAFLNTPEKITANRRRMRAEEINSIYYQMRR